MELIFEDMAVEQGDSVEIPAWEMGECASLEDITAQQVEMVAKQYALQPWETRVDVPDWAREVALVATIHGQHYSGYIFNDYAKMLTSLQWLAERFDPRRTLVYLPGWEGRYYWQYGDYRPDPRMGGNEGFERLMQGGHALGFHLMPMFGINVANRGLPNFEQWGEPAVFTSAGGNQAGLSVDWDGSRHYDHGWGRQLNPGAQIWQNRLVQQVTGLVDHCGFEAVFLDITAAFWNDPHNDVVAGTTRMVERIRANRPHLLVAGEGWYDGLGAVTPLVLVRSHRRCVALARPAHP